MADPTFKLEGVIKSSGSAEDFEGPLALILQLLGKNKIEIKDIKISDILEQYLAYLDEMKRMDLDIASEFVIMASHLIYIKARTLLAGEETVNELESLISSLEELRLKRSYEAIKVAAEYLERRSALGIDVFVRQREVPGGSVPYKWIHSATELRDALISITGREDFSVQLSQKALMPARLVYPVGEKTEELMMLLRRKGRLSLEEIYASCRERSELVASFMAVLELMRSGTVFLTQVRDGCELSITEEDNGFGN